MNTRRAVNWRSLRRYPRAGKALTDRQLAIVALLARGLTQREAAGQLYITESTVSTQLRAVRCKLEAATTADAVATCRDRGLVR